MHVAAAEDAPRGLILAEQEAATLLRGRLTRVHEDLLAKPARQDELSSFDQRPPAIAGMTMTSLPSGTAAPLPPRVRASSSPMYTLT